MASKKTKKQGRRTTASGAAKATRRRKRQASGSSRAVSVQPADSVMGLTMPGASEPWGYVHMAPQMTANELNRAADAGEVISDVDLTDPPLGQALRRRSARWVDDLEPANSTWELAGSGDDSVTNDEFPQPLIVGVHEHGGHAQWYVNYPAPDEQYREPDEVFSSRDELLIALDRIEHEFGPS